MAGLKRKKLAPLDPDEILADSVSVFGRMEGVESKLERPIERMGSLFFLFMIISGLAFLAYRAFNLEIREGASFFMKSQENRFVVRPIFPARGVIYDRFGESLVENVPSFGLVFEKKDFLKGNKSLASLLEGLAEFLGRPKEFFFELGFPKNYDPKDLPDNIFLVQDLKLSEVVSFSSRLNEFPGIRIFESNRRIYKDPLAHSHVLGFIGRVSEKDISLRPELSGEEFVGKAGIEYFYDTVLRGKRGRKIVEVDALGRESRFRLTQAPEKGSRLRLTIDGEFERVIYDILERFIGQTKSASVVAVDPSSGAVLSLVSYPGFDINKFGYNLRPEEFEEILKDPRKPLFNRAISGEFPSGSTIKPLVAAAALEENIIDPQKKILDVGYIEIPNPYRPGEYSRFLDWRPHGWVNLYDALALSANVYFYIIGGGFEEVRGLGIERIKEYATRFGLGLSLGIDLPGEKAGFFPDPGTKKIFEPDNPIWRIGDTYNVSIGQGGVKVTPLQMAMVTSAIANGGTLFRPYVMDAVMDEEGKIVSQNKPSFIRTGLVSKESLGHVIKGMRQAVTNGTARLLSGLPVGAGAKTGTAQAGSGLPHAWVIAFAPVDDAVGVQTSSGVAPKIALAVMVEHAGEGATVAMPIAYEILRWYFENRK